MRPMIEKKAGQNKQYDQTVQNKNTAEGDNAALAEPVGTKQISTDTQVESKPNTPDISAQPVVPQPKFIWQGIAAEQEVVLENDVVKAVFSNIGACLKSLVVNGKDNIQGFEFIKPVDYKIQPMYIDLAGQDSDQIMPVFQVKKVSENIIEFSRSIKGMTETKTITLNPDNFQFDVQYSIKADDDTLTFIDGIAFTLGSISKIHQKDKREQLKAVTLINEGKGQIETINLKGKKGVKKISGKIVWGCVKNKYYTLICKPNMEYESIETKKYTEGKFVTYLRSTHFVLKKGEELKFDYFVYAGPQVLSTLSAYKADFEKSMYFTGIFGWINLALIKSLNLLYSFCRNYGIAIILLTIFIKLIFYPLTRKSFRSMKHMQELQPKIAVLKEKFKDNQKKLQQETMALYKREKVNPLGGCLPMLIQLPIFIGLYRTLSNAYELIHAKFFWIQSLSEPDKLFMIPFNGTEYPLNILPLIMGITMFVQQKMSSADPQQQKMMMFMPIIFTFILYNLPSGLVLYWTLSNLLSIIQQHYAKTS